MRKPGPRGRGSRERQQISPTGFSPSFYPSLAMGVFRQRITIQAPVYIPDEIGGYSGGIRSADDGWEDVTTIWAYVQTINPTSFVDEKQWRDKQFLEQQWYSVTVRYRGDITTNMRFVYKTKKLIVYSIVNRDLLNWQTTSFCREGG